jgi:hypothetical protein
MQFAATSHHVKAVRTRTPWNSASCIHTMGSRHGTQINPRVVVDHDDVRLGVVCFADRLTFSASEVNKSLSLLHTLPTRGGRSWIGM